MLSPFSLEHEWVIHWDRIPSNFKPRPIIGKIQKDEERALKSIACVGLITRKQLFNLFKLGKGKLERMEKQHRIIKHMIVMDNKIRIPIYSLGVNGAKIVGLEAFENNYWVEYRINDILKRLLFFNFYERLPNVEEILPSPDPFVSSILVNGHMMYVYVVRGEMNDIMMHLKWHNFNERMIVIAESLLHLEQLKPFLHDMKLRVILDEGILNKEVSMQESFYLLEDNQFIKENVG